jgi:hypothetical protein
MTLANGEWSLKITNMPKDTPPVEPTPRRAGVSKAGEEPTSISIFRLVLRLSHDVVDPFGKA